MPQHTAVKPAAYRRTQRIFLHPEAEPQDEFFEMLVRKGRAFPQCAAAKAQAALQLDTASTLHVKSFT
jgi:hypothetical protein